MSSEQNAELSTDGSITWQFGSHADKTVWCHKGEFIGLAKAEWIGGFQTKEIIGAKFHIIVGREMKFIAGFKNELIKGNVYKYHKGNTYGKHNGKSKKVSKNAVEKAESLLSESTVKFTTDLGKKDVQILEDLYVKYKTEWERTTPELTEYIEKHAAVSLNDFEMQIKDTYLATIEELNWKVTGDLSIIVENGDAQITAQGGDLTLKLTSNSIVLKNKSAKLEILADRIKGNKEVSDKDAGVSSFNAP